MTVTNIDNELKLVTPDEDKELVDTISGMTFSCIYLNINADISNIIEEDIK